MFTSDYSLAFLGANNYTVEFNFCRYVQRRCHGQAPSYYGAVSNATDCFYLRDAVGNATQYELLREGEEPGLRVTRWDSRETGLTLVMDLLCARDVPNLRLVRKGFNEGNQTMFAVYEAAGVCPQKLTNQLWSALYALRWPLALLAFVLGPLELLLGYKLFRLTVFLLGFLLLFVGLAAAASLLLLRSDSSYAWTYVVLAGCVIPSVVGGYVLSLIAPAGVLVAGAAGGLCLAFLLNYLVLWRVESTPSWLMLYVLLLHCTLLGAVLAYEFKDVVVIAATSFVGAYVTVRAVSLVLGGFVNEFELNTWLQTGVMADLPWTMYLYLLVILGLFAMGTFLQMQWRPHRLEYVVQNQQLADTLKRVNNFELRK